MSVLFWAGLINPPSMVISFREVTMLISEALNIPILIEAEPDEVDNYYNWIRKLGGMDFVEDFVSPGTEFGFRVDSACRFPNTVVIIDRIVSDNTSYIAGGVKASMNKFD